MRGSLTRRALVAGAAGLSVSAFAPHGLRLSTPTRRDLWRRSTGPHLRGAVFVQRRVYRELDGPEFLGPGPVGPPVTDQALDSLADAGANLASWSGPGLFYEAAPFRLDTAIEDHIADWLDRCRARGLYTTLCLRSGPGRSAFAFHPDESWYPPALYDASLWQSRDKQDAWIEMVIEMLRRFGQHPALAGIVPLEEPNAFNLGLERVWPDMARRLADRLAGEPNIKNTPVLFSPDRWARAEVAGELRSAVGDGPVVAVHDYDPWSYTHQSEDEALQYNARRMADRTVGNVRGDFAVLEFGAVRRAPGVADYFADRIARWESLGASWAAFRWTTGWDVYEQSEGGMTQSADGRVQPILRQAFARNTQFCR